MSTFSSRYNYYGINFILYQIACIFVQNITILKLLCVIYYLAKFFLDRDKPVMNIAIKKL